MDRSIHTEHKQNLLPHYFCFLFCVFWAVHCLSLYRLTTLIFRGKSWQILAHPKQFAVIRVNLVFPFFCLQRLVELCGILYLGILRLTMKEYFFWNNGADFVKEELCKKGLEAWKHMLIIWVSVGRWALIAYLPHLLEDSAFVCKGVQL